MYLKIFITILLPLFLYSNENVNNINIGYHNNVNIEPKYKNSKSALNIWVKDFAKNIYEDINMKLYSNKQDKINDYIANKLDVISLSPYEYIKNKKSLNNKTINYLHLQKSENNPFEKMYLIVNKKSNIDTVLDLKDKKIGINTNNIFAKQFLEKVYIKETKKNAKEILLNIDYSKSNSLLLQTYFKKYDAAIISSYEYDVMLELNPAIKKKIKILKKSPRIFPYLLIFFNKNSTPNNKKILQDIINNFFLNNKKNQLYEILKVKEIRRIEKKDLDPLGIYYEEYLRLKRKYK